MRSWREKIFQYVEQTLEHILVLNIVAEIDFTTPSHIENTYSNISMNLDNQIHITFTHSSYIYKLLVQLHTVEPTPYSRAKLHPFKHPNT